LCLQASQKVIEIRYAKRLAYRAKMQSFILTKEAQPAVYWVPGKPSAATDALLAQQAEAFEEWKQQQLEALEAEKAEVVVRAEVRKQQIQERLEQRRQEGTAGAGGEEGEGGAKGEDEGEGGADEEEEGQRHEEGEDGEQQGEEVAWKNGERGRGWGLKGKWVEELVAMGSCISLGGGRRMVSVLSSKLFE
jgi:hypothetical protein